jgi:hypothetical protein
MNNSYNRSPVEPASPTFKLTLRSSTSSVSLKSTVASVRNKAITLKPARVDLNLKSCSEKKLRDKKTTLGQPRSRSYKTLRLLKKPSS